MEETQLELKRLLYHLPLEKLKGVVAEASIPVKLSDNTVAKLTSAVEKFIVVSAAEDDADVKLTNLLTMMRQKSDQANTAVQNVVPHMSVRKELNIQGTINTTSGISFLNVIRQMDAANTRGYKDSEVIEAVIRAVHPTQELRGYLESQVNLTLPVLRKLLRCYFKEKTATELYQELSEGRQLGTEQTLDFVLRLLTLGQKITFTSREEGSGLCYDPLLVRRMTLRSIYTGLGDPTISQEMRPLLSGDPTDEEIITKINQVVAAANERTRKHSGTRMQRSKVASVEAETEVSSLVSMMAELKAEVASVKEGLEQSRNSRQKDRGNNNKTEKRGCPNCRKTGETCDHCYYCGSSEHFMPGCKLKRQQSGNGKGPTRRDS